jgi:L-fucose isomerase
MVESKLKKLGFGEESNGHNAILADPGTASVDDHMRTGFHGSHSVSSFDWNGIRPPYLVATENDVK